jgi:HEPN domain-containing protein
MDRYEEASEWLGYSKNDLEAANQLMTFHPPKVEIICYLCQQSAEKALKAFLVYFETKPPKVHDMEQLRSLCESIDNSFSEVFNECSRLNDYSSQPRYPFGIELTEDDMRLAVNDSEKIIELTKGKIIICENDKPLNPT